MPRVRKRRANSQDGARTIKHVVKVNPAEEALLQAKAQDSNVTVSRLLVETTLNTNTTPVRAVMLEVSGIRRTHQGIATNLNQLARASNSGTRFTDEITDTIRQVKDVNTKLTEVIERTRHA